MAWDYISRELNFARITIRKYKNQEAEAKDARGGGGSFSCMHRSDITFPNSTKIAWKL